MALRVLLADESTTIKRVMQLALQDYGVDVKSVPVGMDVLPVARTFQPDIVFVDVLLQKKSGYEVARELKADPSFGDLPVVLMWSGFMELDEAKATESKVDRRLEKPFDAEVLRSLVQDLVPRTNENLISSYLKFPEMPDFTEPAGSRGTPSAPGMDKATAQRPSSPTPPGSAKPAAPDLMAKGSGVLSPSGAPLAPNTPLSVSSLETVDSIYDIPEAPEDQFSTVPLTSPLPMPTGPASASNATPDEGWSHQDLSKFKIEIPAETGHDFEKYMIPADDLSMAKVENSGEFQEIVFVNPRPAEPARPAANANKSTTSSPLEKTGLAPETGLRASATDQVLAEKILREEVRGILEKIAWQVLPEIAERIVKDELNKLLKEVEKNI